MTSKEEQWLNSLIKVRDVLDDYNLQYFLDTGTLLGAVRDKRFIPWDNDIDIGIVECNYDEILFDNLTSSFYNAGFCVIATTDNILLFTKDYAVEIGLKFYFKNGGFYETQLGKVESSQTFFSIAQYLKGAILFRKGYGYRFKILTYCSKVLLLLSHVTPRKITSLIILRSKYTCRTVRIQTVLLVEFVPYDFYNVKFQVPSLYSNYLVCRYGDNWNISNPNYNYITDDCSLR